MIEKIAMGAKPDSYNFTIRTLTVINGNTIILAVYPGSLTFKGRKLMLLKGDHSKTDFTTLDPHFLDDDYDVVARFIPNQKGWELAYLCANNY